VGADRIAANGDVANKIGTYMVAVLAHENGIPFYVAAPLSTIDLSLASGEQIPIEERSSREVTELKGLALAPTGVAARHPAFDVTPHRYITAIITERGIAREPYVESWRGCSRSNRPWAVLLRNSTLQVNSFISQTECSRIGKLSFTSCFPM